MEPSKVEMGRTKCVQTDLFTPTVTGIHFTAERKCTLYIRAVCWVIHTRALFERKLQNVKALPGEGAELLTPLLSNTMNNCRRCFTAVSMTGSETKCVKRSQTKITRGRSFLEKEATRGKS